MMRKTTTTILAARARGTGACAPTGDPTSDVEEEREIDPAFGPSSLERRIAELEDRVRELELETMVDRIINSPEKKEFAWLSPASAGSYSTFETNHGPMAVMVTDTEPFANGTPAALRFANLAPATRFGERSRQLLCSPSIL